MKILKFVLVAVACAQPVRACDICAIYSAAEARGEAGRGFFGGIAEQYTYFGNLQEDGESVSNPTGQYLNSSISQLFVGYNISKRAGVQFNAPVIYRSFRRPEGFQIDEGTESGLGDVEGQIRWRWRRETERRPELFSYAEFVVPHAKDKVLIGTPGVELKFGAGVARGFHWGTLTARAAAEYSEASSSPWDLGEYAVEYLKRLSRTWRVYAGIEGQQDEVSLITEAQWHILPYGFVRLNTGIGLTSKATDWTPELGVLFTWPFSR